MASVAAGLVATGVANLAGRESGRSSSGGGDGSGGRGDSSGGGPAVSVGGSVQAAEAGDGGVGAGAAGGWRGGSKAMVAATEKARRAARMMAPMVKAIEDVREEWCR